MYTPTFILEPLFCSEYSVAGVAETGNDVRVLVEPFIAGGDIDIDVGMILLDTCDAFGTADDAHELDMLHAVFLEEGDRRRGGAAGCEHGVNDDDVALLNIGGHFVVVFNRLVGFGIAEKMLYISALR